MIPRTNYLLFLDECGTHDMGFVDPRFPVFVLLGLLVGERYYARTLVPSVKEIKRQHIGTTEVSLHSRDIRRGDGAFKDLVRTPERKAAFYEAINTCFDRSRLRLYAIVIDKEALRRRSLFPLNPYHVSLSQLLSLVCGPPRAVGANRPNIVRIVAESRGRVEDKDLQREYQQLRADGLMTYGATDVMHRRPATVQRLFPPRVDFAPKSRFVAGLELADLAAYPIARAAINRDWSNRSAAVVAAKLRALVLFP
ncbi:MAG TPA: DUF3800 domain-containing protein [Tepidisphaeraceae bacterium]|nr:DUF3800 domain-containing protein [Tepidisphaeraceae bacterium]